MNIPSPDLITLLTIAAELRAAGAAWEKIGEEVGRSPHTCRRWPLLHRREWNRLYNAAAQQLTKDAGEEARKFLRAHMRSKDPKISLAASHYLEKFDQALMARQDEADVKDLERPDPEKLEHIDSLEAISDVELDARMRRYLEHSGLAGEGDAAGARPAAGPPPSE